MNINRKRKSLQYSACSQREKEKANDNFFKIAEYEDFYLFGKYDRNGNLLYKECFSKFDIDGPKVVLKKVSKIYEKSRWR